MHTVVTIPATPTPLSAALPDVILHLSDRQSRKAHTQTGQGTRGKIPSIPARLNQWLFGLFCRKRPQLQIIRPSFGFSARCFHTIFRSTSSFCFSFTSLIYLSPSVPSQLHSVATPTPYLATLIPRRFSVTEARLPLGNPHSYNVTD